MPASDCALLRLSDRERDQEERYADAVVEAALDVQALSDSRGESLQAHDGLPEGRVRRGEDDREDECLRPRERVQERERGDESGHEGERQAESQQPRGNAELPAQDSQVDARRVREEHDGQRGLCEELHLLPRRRRVDDPPARRRRRAGRPP